MGLNKYQEEAVNHFQGPCMVLAGPGSGKTLVITKRVQTLIETYHVNPENILVITFTKAAAMEMKNRFIKNVEKERNEDAVDYGAVTFGTFHAVFFKILRSEKIYENAAVMEDTEKLILLSEILQEQHIKIEEDAERLETVLSEFSFVKNNGKNPREFESAIGTENFAKVFYSYEKKCRDKNFLDFDDMLLLTKKLLKKRPDVLSYYREKYQFILIDEFQDINPLQYEIMALLAAPRNNLFIVGDDDQSIYRFRGAKPKIMLDFPKKYKDTRRVLLGINYRSGSKIVENSLRLVEHNKDRFRKKLVAAKKEEGSITLREFKSDSEECDQVTSEIRKLHENNIPYDEMAVLVRTNFGSSMILQKFLSHKIPFITKDQVPNIFSHFLLKPFFGCMNFIFGNPSRRNFFLFMNTPNRYFRREDFQDTRIDLEGLKEHYRRNPENRWRAERVDYFQYQLHLLKSLKTPYAMLNYFRKGMEYDLYVREYAKKKNMDPGELLERLDVVQETARSYSKLTEWYDYIESYSAELKKQSESQRDTRGKVLVATFHGSKGLEFDEVFILDANEGNTPHDKSKKPEEMEEERRMFYVAMTRARRNLRIYSTEYRFEKQAKTSRFIRELK